MLYERKTGHIVKEAGFITSADRLFGVSVDGLVGNEDVIEELEADLVEFERTVTPTTSRQPIPSSCR